MNVPWRYLLGLTLGFVVGVIVFVGLLYTQLGVPTLSTQWLFDITNKKTLYAAKFTGPRLFIVAGSSALFGINAQLIQQQTGLPTINMGTSAGYPLDYRLDCLKKIVRPGDTLLLAFEYESYTNQLINYSDAGDDYLLAHAPEYFLQTSLLYKIEMATRIPFKRLQKGWRNRETPERERPPGRPYIPYLPITPGIDCLNDNGDEVFNMAATRRPPGLEMQHVSSVLLDGLPSENTDGFETIDSFLQWAATHQITVWATFPNIINDPAYDGPNGQKAIETITHFYTSRGVPIIGTAKEAMLPYDQFFDTNYHLTHEAAIKRTERLIPELEPYLHATK